MEQLNIKELDELYLRYGYEVKGSSKNRVYLFKKGIYFGADIVPIIKNTETEKLQNEFSKLGYAVKLRDYSNLSVAAETLFRDFFQAGEVVRNLERRYKNFVKGLMANLPENATYQYIRSPYEITKFDANSNNGVTNGFSAEDAQNNLVDKNLELINNHRGPLLIIIEAAAGYGKTCTAYEILAQLIRTNSNKLPFFTELSRDRQASIFKHILLLEIEEQFSNRVDSNLVIHEIKTGHIPLIIDGFDELISKDFRFSTNQFEQVESMLSTVIDLLSDDAKIIITSRKTAIFDSEEFHNWMLNRNIPYTFVQVTISEPSIENWLEKERREIINESNFKLKQYSNPVLLSYLRYVNIDSLRSMMLEDKSIVDKYFSFLLEREQNRQDLHMEPEKQLKIFRQLVRIFTSFDIKAEKKEFIKEIFLDYNKEILEEVRKSYRPDSRPRLDQLADILTNHAILDKKKGNLIGLVNEFVFGTLVAENLILGEYQAESEDFYKDIPQLHATLAVEAFSAQPREKQRQLWIVFNQFPFPYDQTFLFRVDIEFKGSTDRNYYSVNLQNYNLKRLSLTRREQFDTVVFENCIFTNCEFSLLAFSNSSFINCKFYSCILMKEETSFSIEYLTIFGGVDDNGFIDLVYDYSENEKVDDLNIEYEVLKLFFLKGTQKPRHRQLSKIKAELKRFGGKLVSKEINRLRIDEKLQINGDLCHLTKSGITYFNENFKLRDHDA